jgi:hypothetical protein
MRHYGSCHISGFVLMLSNTHKLGAHVSIVLQDIGKSLTQLRHIAEHDGEFMAIVC